MLVHHLNKYNVLTKIYATNVGEFEYMFFDDLHALPSRIPILFVMSTRVRVPVFQKLGPVTNSAII